MYALSHRITTALLSLLLLAGCSTSPVVKLYEGEERPRSALTIVRVPMELEVLTINDKRVENVNTVFSMGYKDLHLVPGRYQFLAYYKDLFDLDAENHEVVKSDPVVFIVDGEAGQLYRLAFETPDNVHAARSLAKNFEGWTENVRTGEQIPTQASRLILDNALTSMIERLTDTTPAMGSANTPAGTRQAASQAIAPHTETPVDAATTSNSAAASADYLNLLKVYWSQANEAERRAFLQWIAR